MRIAVISDIHGNLAALDAVLQDLRATAHDSVICLGDLAYKGPAPSECVREIRERNIPCVHGNTDLRLLGAMSRNNVDTAYTHRENRHETPYLQWHANRMTEEDAAFLQGLPFQFTLRADGLTLLFVHGTPRDAFAGVLPTDPPEQVRAHLRDAQADWVIMGHVHIPFAHRFEGRQLVNAGAVGFSLDGDWRASYVVLDTGTRSAAVRRVEYDREEAVALARARSFCFSPDWYGKALAQGWWEPIPFEKRRDIDGVVSTAEKD